MNALRSIAIWVDNRLHITKLWEQTGGHAVPKSTGSWFYTFGSMTLMCFTIQIITGILLSMNYVPSAAEAYRTLEVLNFQQPLGWFVRGVHYWGSNCMVIIMILHMTQVFLFGAYKYPREMTWISGCVLLFLTLGLAFSGQVMRFDSDAYWGVGIGAAILGRIPLIGDQLVNLLLGGPIIGSDTLSRFFALHVFVLPGGVLALVALHLRLVLSKGINEMPKPGVLVERETYDNYYKEDIKKSGVPFVPGVFNKDIVANGVLILIIFALAAFVGPKGPGIPADPTQVISEARPDYPFLWLFAAAALMPNGSEVLLFFILPVIGSLILFALPFISNEGEKSWRRRPVAVLIVLVTYLTIGMLTWAGLTSPWSPQMEAWSSFSIPEPLLKSRAPVELAGALVFQNKQCRNCHAIEGVGGHRGPDLTTVATRLTQPQLVRQVIQGGGNMPAYGRTLSPQEIRALTGYLYTLHPPNQIPAQPAIGPLSPEKRSESTQNSARTEGGTSGGG